MTIICYVFVSETWFQILREEHTSRMFQNEVLRKISEHQKDRERKRKRRLEEEEPGENYKRIKLTNMNVYRACAR